MSDSGRTRHFVQFYSGMAGDMADRPLWLAVGNCQAEALRCALETVADPPFRTVRMPPVHELGKDDLPRLDALLARTSVLLCQPIRADYRELPLGTRQLAARLPAGAVVLRWPVIRYAGLYPFQVIVRRPADRSVVPPPVPYHDLRTVSAARAGRTAHDPWDVDVAPAAFRAVADASIAALAERERRDCDVAVSDVLRDAGCDAAHAINHPGNTVLAALANRILAARGVVGEVALGADPLLGSVHVPLEQRVLDALNLAGPARNHWQYIGGVLGPNGVHRVQMQWYRNNADFLELAVARHGATMELLGLAP